MDIMISGSVVSDQGENDCNEVLIKFEIFASGSAILVYVLLFCIGFELQGQFEKF